MNSWQRTFQAGNDPPSGVVQRTSRAAGKRYSGAIFRLFSPSFNKERSKLNANGDSEYVKFRYHRSHQDIGIPSDGKEKIPEHELPCRRAALLRARARRARRNRTSERRQLRNVLIALRSGVRYNRSKSRS